jgi:hypothetical protein
MFMLLRSSDPRFLMLNLFSASRTEAADRVET